MITVKVITSYLETIAPIQYQENYDNSGLIVGDSAMEVKGVLVCLDSTEEVVNEAIERGCNLIVAHHPIIFGGIKKLNGKNYVEKAVITAIKNNVAIYAIHTNLDNVLHNGVNETIADKLKLQNCKILLPKAGMLTKLTTFVPLPGREKLLQGLFEAGAGQIGDYKNCSFTVEGVGTFKPTGNANPAIGQLEKDESLLESRVEVIFPSFLKAVILNAMRRHHPYEEVAYYLETLENVNNEIGAGIIGELETEMDTLEFLHSIKTKMNVECIRYTQLSKPFVKTIAVCGGSGSFLLKEAISQQADVFISADFKYHEFFDAENRITIADIGHFESEQHTINLLFDIINKKFSNFAVHLTQVVTNPVKYL